jgi:hypothetical protein
LTLVNSNALLDILTADPAWCHWSTRQLEAASVRGPLGIPAISLSAAPASVLQRKHG